MPKVYVNGVNIYYQQHGAGPDLVFISGYSSDHRTWLTLLPALKRHFRVTLFDNRGMGQSDSPAGDYTETMMAADVSALMDALGIDSAFVVGHSMGGFITQALCVHYASRVKKAVLLCSRVMASVRYMRLLEINHALLAAKAPAELVIKNTTLLTLSSRFLENEEKLNHYVRWICQNPYPLTIRGLSGQTALTKNYQVTSHLGQVTQPLLAIFGDEDLVALPEGAKVVQEHAPHASTEVWEHCGHIPQLEQRRRLEQRLVDWLLL